MHPRQRYVPLKPQLNQLNRNSRFGRGVLGAWLINDDGGLRAIGGGTTENYPPAVWDAGPYSCHFYEYESSYDEMRTVESPWGLAIWGGTGSYNEVRNDWGKYWEGLTAVSSFILCRAKTNGIRRNLLCAGLSGTTTEKLTFEIASDNRLRYACRAGAEVLQGVYSTATFTDTTAWHAFGGSGRVVNGGGIYRLYHNGVELATTETPNHSYSAFDGQYGAWVCRVAGIDYQLNQWADVDVAFCMHWGWELTPEDFASLYADPFQAFYRPELSRFEKLITEAQVSYFIVNLEKNTGQNITENVRTVVVDAPSADIARDMAESLYEGDADWDDATATLVEAASDPYAGSTWRIRVSGAPVPSPDIVDVRYVAQAGDSLSAILDALIAKLNGPGSPIRTAARVGNTLTVAAGSENLGDRTVTIDITPVGSSTSVPNRVGLPVDTITHQGASGSDLGIAFLDTGLPRVLVAR